MGAARHTDAADRRRTLRRRGAGAGIQDRDETIGPNKPLRDLAWGLASQGIAVLALRERTKQNILSRWPPQKDKITLKEEAVDDAVAAAALLRGEPQEKSIANASSSSVTASVRSLGR